MSLQCYVSGMQPDWLTHIWAKTKRLRNSAAALLCAQILGVSSLRILRIGPQIPTPLISAIGGAAKARPRSSRQPTRPHTHTQQVDSRVRLSRSGWRLTCAVDGTMGRSRSLGRTAANQWSTRRRTGDTLGGRLGHFRAELAPESTESHTTHVCSRRN